MRKFLAASVLGAMCAAVIVSGCTVDSEHGDGRDPDRETVSQEVSEREGHDSEGEHGGGREGNESSGEHSRGSGERSPAGEGSGTRSDGGGESNEAAMSSPITPLGQSWNGVLGGLAVAMRYDAETRSVHGTVRNTLAETLCYVQAEPSPEVGYEDSRRAWSPEAREPESRTGSNVKPVGRQ